MASRSAPQFTPAQVAALLDVLANPGAASPVADGGVPLAKLAPASTGRLMGRAAAGSGAPGYLTAAQVRTLLGISNVADVAPADMPVSVAQQAYIDNAIATGIADALAGYTPAPPAPTPAPVSTYVAAGYVASGYVN